MGHSFHVENFGCRAARADGEAVSEQLRAMGFEEGTGSQAQVVVVNTCSVTAEADRSARSFIRRTHRLNPEARVVVTGCYAQRAPQELASLPGVSAVIGNSHKALAPGIIAQSLHDETSTALQGAAPAFVPLSTLHPANSPGTAPVWADDRFAHSFLEDLHLVPGTQTRPNLKIQEGCSNRCTFCVIPDTRGPSRSMKAEKIIDHVRRFVAAGGNELVLSGINLGRWGRDRKERRFGGDDSLARLVRTILDETELPWIRLSSIEPMDWDDDLIALLREFGGRRLARHAHLPLQSGSDAVLRRMHRRYRPWHYADKVAALSRAAGPDLTLGADVMAGFPGETDAEFSETVQMLQALPFGYLHLFPFSPRPGTPGWELHRTSAVPATVVAERMAILRGLAQAKCEQHRRRFLGRTLEAITLHTPDRMKKLGQTQALTENFIPADLEGAYASNQKVRIQLKGLDSDLTVTASLES